MTAKTLLHKALRGKNLTFSELDILSKNPQCSKLYAQKVLRRRFPQGEESIKTNPSQAYLYAKDVLYDRWKEGEEIISSSPDYSLKYALNILRSRFSKGEKSIAKSGELSLSYAKNILYDRFKLGEESILELSPGQIADYCVNCLKKRWIRAEAKILLNAEAAFYYASNLNFRWAEAEKIILTSSQSAYLYARDILKQKWPEAEDVISKSGETSLAYALFLEERFEKGEDSIIKTFDSIWSKNNISLYVANCLKGNRWLKLEDYIENFSGDSDELLEIIKCYSASCNEKMPDFIHNRMIAEGISNKDNWRINQYFSSIKQKEDENKLLLLERFNLDEIREMIKVYISSGKHHDN